MNKKVLGLVVAVIVVCASVAAFLVESSLAPPQQPTKELDFTVSGTSDCLRFLNSTVPTIYVPFTTAANENWQLTINCTKMPGAPTVGLTCTFTKATGIKEATINARQETYYPILSDIQNTNRQIRANGTFTETYGGSTPQSYTVFFVVPPGGQATFHVTFKPV